MTKWIQTKNTHPVYANGKRTLVVRFYFQAIKNDTLTPSFVPTDHVYNQC